MSFPPAYVQNLPSNSQILQPNTSNDYHVQTKRRLDEPSELPTKRLRIDAIPLRPLPPCLLLLSIAETIHKHSCGLLPQLGSQVAWDAYQKSQATRIVLLRRIIERAEGGKIELEARLALLEILKETNNSSDEFESVISRGLTNAASHPALHMYYPHFLLMSIKSDSPENTKFSQTSLKRYLATVDPYLSPAFAAIWYTLSIQLASISDFNSAHKTLREVDAVASGRRDEAVLWTARIILSLRALKAQNVPVAAEYLTSIAQRYWAPTYGAAYSNLDPSSIDPTRPAPPLPLPNALKIYFLLIYCTYTSETGSTKLAKERLKEAHQLLDAKESENGSCIVPLGNNVDAVHLQLPHVDTIYSFAFLISVAVHKDPFGRDRASLYANEGIRTLRQRLEGKEALPLSLNNPQVQTAHVQSLTSTRVYIHLIISEFFLMRSDFKSCQDSINQTVALARNADVWDSVSGRVLLVQGLLYVATGRTEEAEKFLRVVTDMEEEETDLHTLASLSIVLLQVSLGVPAITITDKNPILSISEESYTGNINISLITNISKALTTRSITEAKKYLTSALAIGNEAGRNYVKCVLLALLSNLFLCTRNDQALKMLGAGFNIASGMSSRPPDPNIPSIEKVGPSRLGLWIGERLLELYTKVGNQDRANNQMIANNAHRVVIAQDEAKYNPTVYNSSSQS